MADDADYEFSLYTEDCLQFAINPNTIVLVLWEERGRNSHFISCKLLNYPKLETLLFQHLDIDRTRLLLGLSPLMEKSIKYLGRGIPSRLENTFHLNYGLPN